MHVRISEIREGDIVLNCGMRILIDGPATIYGEKYGNPADEPVYSWPGLVVNADAICKEGGEEYDAYIACHLRGQWWQDRGGRKDSWPVNSNDRESWEVERPGSAEAV
jgi:hypothetical protein